MRAPQLERYAKRQSHLEASFGVEQSFDKANELVVVLSKGRLRGVNLGKNRTAYASIDDRTPGGARCCSASPPNGRLALTSGLASARARCETFAVALAPTRFVLKRTNCTGIQSLSGKHR